MKNITKIKNIYVYVIPGILFLGGLVFALLFTISLDAHYTVMPVLQKQDSYLSISGNEITDKNNITGEFIASENNLGSIALRLQTKHEELDADRFKVNFRIKEKDAKNWYAENSYTGGQFRELDLFPFGFNLIPESKNKRYYFEISTVGVSEKNALTTVKNQNIVGMYQLNKSDLKNPVYALKYIIGKHVYLFNNFGALLVSLYYFIPLITYLYLVSELTRLYSNFQPIFGKLRKLFSPVYPFVRKIEKTITDRVNFVLNFMYEINLLEENEVVKNISFLQILLFLLILIDILFIQSKENSLTYMILVIWVITLLVYKSRVLSSFLFTIVFLLLTIFFILLNVELPAEKASIWAYLFLLVGTIHAIYIIRSHKMNTKK